MLTKGNPLEKTKLKLSSANLKALPSNVGRPTYDRTKLTLGIIHIGLGNFHRAHQSWYLHRLFEKGLNTDWAIIGAGVRSFDETQRQKLEAQDFLTTLIKLDPFGESAEVVGSMIDYVPIEQCNGPLIKKMTDPAIRIVALTVTEGGHYIDPATDNFSPSNPDIQFDRENPEKPKTAFGAIVAALKLRRDRGVGPFTVQSCDNLQGNGDTTRQTVVSLARLSDPKLADWIDANCSFPNAMVDCIVPATGPAEILLAQNLGIEDAVPVTHENFRQWVIEDDFCAGRPDWEKVGVIFSDNVHGYETQKIRILNAGHQIIVNIAEILHIETISEAMLDPQIHAFFRKVQEEEIVPHVVPVSGMTPLQYVNLVDRRFSNPAIVDTTRRVAFDGSSRHPGMVLPTVRDGLAKGISVDGLAFAEAAWARMCEGTREDGSAVEPNDPAWEELVEIAKRAKEDPLVWLEMRQTYGALADQPHFADAFGYWLAMIWREGIELAMTTYCKSTVRSKPG
jgi:mannitol 2-dehydrogenase